MEKGWKSVAIMLANSSSILCCLAGVICFGINWLIVLWVAVRWADALVAAAAVVVGLGPDTTGSVDVEPACPLSSNCTVGSTVLICLCRFVVEPALTFIYLFFLQWRHSVLLFTKTLNYSQMLLCLRVSVIFMCICNAHTLSSSPLSTVTHWLRDNDVWSDPEISKLPIPAFHVQDQFPYENINISQIKSEAQNIGPQSTQSWLCSQIITAFTFSIDIMLCVMYVGRQLNTAATQQAR